MLSTLRTNDVVTANAENGDGLSMTTERNFPGPLFSCPDCVYKTTSLRKLGRHRSVNHAGVKYRCEHCDFVTGYQSNYYRHRKQVHNGGMSQSALQATTTSSPPNSQAQQPTNFRINSNSFQNGSSIVQSSHVTLNGSQQKHTTTGFAASPASLKCDHCPFQTSSADQLMSHIFMVHNSESQRVCAECGITMLSKNQLQEHIRIYHSNGQLVLPKANYANFFSALTGNGSAAALTAAHLIMAAMANGGAGCPYDLNILASAATMSSKCMDSQQRSFSPDQAKTLDLSTKCVGRELDKDDNCQRYYACVYDCDFASRSSRDYLHHLRDEHQEQFTIFYCDECSDYATKFVARLWKHKTSMHGTKLSTIDNHGKNSKNGISNGMHHSSVSDEDVDEESDEPKLSIVIEQQPNQNSESIESNELDEAEESLQDEIIQAQSLYLTVEQMDMESDKATVVIPESASSVQSSHNSENSRHSAPTPPALLVNSSSPVRQENRRHQVYHNRMHHRRRQQQQRQQLQQQRQALNPESRRMRKFLSEQEAIEIPLDASGSEFDNDPDIKNRRCSVCGYQGKWISEMIRHKRVHTNERPFKCKYCSRTSKWKADLIRHVAKVHGFRVVSKYSRSKTFDDADQTAMKALKEVSQCSSPAIEKFQTTTPVSQVSSLKQEISTVDNNVVNDSNDGLNKESGLNLSMAERKDFQNMTTLNFLDGSKKRDLHDARKLETTKNGHYDKTKMQGFNRQQFDHHQTLDGQQQAAAAALMFRQLYNAIESRDGNRSNFESSLSNSSSISPTKELRDIISSKQLTGALEKYVMIKQTAGGDAILKCRVCPYETRDLHTFRAHTQKHENKKPYLCSTCGYRSNWSSDVHKHIRLKKTGHETAYVVKLNESDLPGQPKGQQEEQLITNVADYRSGGSDSSSVDGALNLTSNSPNSVSLLEDDRKSVDHASSSISNGEAKAADWLQLAHLYLLGGFTGFPANTGALFTSVTPDAGFEEQTVSTNGTANGKVSQSKDFRCEKCPYVGRTTCDVAIHEKGHLAPSKGLLCYKCVFCDWYASKKTLIFEHMKVHTDQPAKYISEVEKNLITPLTRKRSAEGSAESAAADALLGLAKAEKRYKPDGLDDHRDNAVTAEIGDEKINNGFDANDECSNDGMLSGSDVDDVMSDFNAIIRAADQDLSQANGFESITQHQSLTNGNTGNGTTIHLGDFTHLMSSTIDSAPIDQEAYIHAGEDAFDSFPRTGEFAKGEIQKVTAVVDGQVRKMWQCRYCPHMSKRRANVRMHEKKHFKATGFGVFKCPKCNYRGDKRSLHVHYRVHMVVENGCSSAMPELFQCSNCPAIFQSQDDLALHSVNHDLNSSKAHRCSRCSYSVSSFSALQKHARVHDRQASFNDIGTISSGDYNGKRPAFQSRRPTSSAAIANVVVQHEEIGSNPFSTTSNNRNEGVMSLMLRGTGKRTAALPDDIQQHTSETLSSPITLDNGTFPFAATLSNSLIKPKKYHCEKCPAKFSDRTQLNRHVQFHGVKLRFKCDICDYSVPFPINLTKHMKSHHNIDATDASTTVSVSDNDNESDTAADTDENGAMDDGHCDSDKEEVEERYSDEMPSSSEPFVPPSPDGRLKIKINLGTFKSSSNVA